MLITRAEVRGDLDVVERQDQSASAACKRAPKPAAARTSDGPSTAFTAPGCPDGAARLVDGGAPRRPKRTDATVGEWRPPAPALDARAEGFQDLHGICRHR
jgi:hypothetical protein